MASRAPTGGAEEKGYTMTTSNLDIIRALLKEMEALQASSADQAKRITALEKCLGTAADSTAAAYPALTAAQKRRANGLKGAVMRKLHAADVAGRVTLVGTWLWLQTDEKVHAKDLPTGWRFSRRRAAWYRRIDD